MRPLSSTQRQYLRRRAHDLRPLAQIGKNGLTEQVITGIDQALAANELMKVKFLDFQDQKETLAQELAAATRSELIGLIGNTAILFRWQPDREKRKIELPA